MIVFSNVEFLLTVFQDFVVLTTKLVKPAMITVVKKKSPKLVVCNYMKISIVKT